MELDAPAAATEVQRVEAIVRSGRDHARAIGWHKHGLDVADVESATICKRAEQRIVPVSHCQFGPAHLPTGRVGSDCAAERMRQQLVAKAHAQDRMAGMMNLGQPGRGALRPGQVVTDHGR